MKKEAFPEKRSTHTPVISAEFFPPKTEDGARQFLETAKELQVFQPDYVSITYGAGGSTQSRTQEYAQILQRDFGFSVMPHLTCVGHSKEEILQIVQGYYDKGHRQIMALRGDKPKDAESFEAHAEGFRYASDLVKLINQHFPEICIGVGGYPEKHPESADLASDIHFLKHKLAQGGSFVTTQLFFDNDIFFDWVEKCRAADIREPIFPGILPVLSLTQVKRFCSFCDASIPEELLAKLEAVQDDESAMQQIGIDWASEQIKDLLSRGAPGVHLYCLNRPDTMRAILERVV